MSVIKTRHKISKLAERTGVREHSAEIFNDVFMSVIAFCNLRAVISVDGYIIVRKIGSPDRFTLCAHV